MERYKPKFTEENLKLKKIDFESIESDEWVVIQDVVKFIIGVLNDNYDGYDQLSKDAFIKLVIMTMRLNKKEPYPNWKKDVSEMYDRMIEEGVTL